MKVISPLIVPSPQPSPKMGEGGNRALRDFHANPALGISLLEEVAERLQQHSPSINAYRDALQQGARRLRMGFEQGEHIEDLVRGRGQLIDEILTAAWLRQVGAETRATLVAVGGYGRGELHPASDIDILILLEEEGEETRERIGHLLTLFWDIGLELGHSVRSLADCVAESRNDITVATNLMESRYLAGQRALFERMRELTGPDRLWPSAAFFAAKLDEQRRRHHKFGDTSYNLEPNIKEGPGGLRDIQAIGWVAKRHYGEETMFGLVRQGFLTEEEYGTLMDGQRLLWRIRFALHLLTGRREDRLLFDYQRTLAEQFGYRDQEHNLAVEQFMQNYYRTIMGLNRLNDLLLQLFREAMVLGRQGCGPVAINKRFQSCNGYLEVTDTQVFQRQPFALLELFLLLAQRPELEGVRAGTIRLIRGHRQLIDDSFRQDRRNRALFMEILRQPGNVRELRRMNRYGLLAAYLPAFAHIVGRMQYDLFHVYTVDEHSLFVVRNLNRLMSFKGQPQFQTSDDIIRRVAKPELLYLAGLFHDIAKGRGGDHSELGALDAHAFCRQHQLSDYDTELVAWLVRNHLLLSITAQRRDISDPEVIRDFARQVGDPSRLIHLFILTLADGQATNPGRWSAWKETLLRELFLAAYDALQRGLDNPRDQQELIGEKKRLALALLTLRWAIGEAAALALWRNFNDSYFLHNLPGEVASQTAVVLNAEPGRLPLVQLRDASERASTEVLIYARDHQRLFANSTALLDQLGLNIVDARIQTTRDGHTLNSYMILEQDGTPVTDRRRQQEIVELLRQGLAEPKRIDAPASRRLARRLRHFDIATRIDFDNDGYQQRTVAHVTTGDRPGLLASIGLALADCGVQLHGAKVATLGEVAEDIFYITGREGLPLNTQETDCLRQALLRRLEPTNP